MGKQTYYIVQIDPVRFVHRSIDGDFVPGYKANFAARLSISEARRLYDKLKGVCDQFKDAPRRFPRILKVTVDMKTITPNR